jgi:serine/threonine-protein kinase
MSQASSSTEALLGEVSSSKFQLLRLLGAGGMGAVFEAEHLLTKRIGALKLLHGHYAQIPEVVERFTREASAAGRIQNPHIVETFDAGRLDSGQPYIFMELLQGTALDALLEARGALPFAEAIGICAQATAGLAAAHRSGIIHRDIKPANLFLVEGKTPLVKILDFGISKFRVTEEVSSVTQEGATLGTPYYMSPEQVMGSKDIDEGVDIYAIGVVLYECVTGKPPYVEETLPALSVRIYEGHYIPVGEFRADVPPGFDRMLARCLAVDRMDRYASAQELLQDLLAMIGRHAESLAPTLMAGSPMPMLSSPLPYVPSQPPGPAAGPSARPGSPVAFSERPSGSAEQQRGVRTWIWPGIAALAIAVLGYLAFGRPQTQPEATQDAVGQPATGAPAGMSPSTAPEPNPNNATTNAASMASAPASSSTSSLEALPNGSDNDEKDTKGSSRKTPNVSGGREAPHPSATSSVRRPPPEGNMQDGLKRENPFE